VRPLVLNPPRQGQVALRQFFQLPDDGDVPRIGRKPY
jgi:hypothetical protein